jgi:hypothetical protein
VDVFQQNLAAHSVDGHEKMQPESFIEITHEINGFEPIFSRICIGLWNF